MSKFEFKLPDIGEGVSEGEIVNWLVKVGDGVKEDQDIVEVMTDKATVTIGAPKAGKITELKGEVGDVVPVGQVLVVFDVDGAGGAAEAAPAEKPAAKPDEAKPAEAKSAEAKPAEPKAATREESKASAVGDIKDELPGMAPPASNGAYFNEKPLAAPATRKLARELDVDLRRVPPSGPNDRVTREDVEGYAKGGAAPAAKGAPAPAVPAATPTTPAPLPPLPRPAEARGDERVPIRGMKKRMFESMARSKRTAAHFTYWEEAEVSGLIALRDRLKPLAEAEGVKLNYLPLIVKAVIASLRKNPVLNAVIDEEKGELVIKHTFDIGIAVSTDNGLIVPVLRNADQLNVLAISREIDRLSSEARAGKARREDLGGSSFTVTSLGKLGGSFATPVINYPEVGILYVPQIKQKPVVKDGQIVVGNTMNLGMSFDHRVIDGNAGASFTQDVAALLENPDRLLLSM
jgi:pyruvate/2-oxoglutarate dehydrogenase complex dihydrolipoamide acyltransferase (E2) component